METEAAWLKDFVRDIPDFPTPGVNFKDLTPLFADAEAFAFAVHAIADRFAAADPTKVIGIEARGFILAAPVALALGAGFVPVRKVGKLPWETEAETYHLEYGTDTLEVHADALGAGDRVLIVDDVIATGGTARATVTLVERLGGSVVGLGVLAELLFLEGRRRLEGQHLVALIAYE
jgi:adenine phosphoribosyltransferase